MPPDSKLWGLDDSRAKQLSIIHGNITRNFGDPHGIVLYPGALVDIENPLFATFYRAKYYIFVDPYDDVLIKDIAVQFKKKFPVSSNVKFLFKGTNDLGAQANTILNDAIYRTNLSLSALERIPFFFCQFEFDGSKKIVFYFKDYLKEFMDKNNSFRIDIVFDKDFWETAEIVGFDQVLPRVKNQGILLSNSPKQYVPAIVPYYGLKHLGDAFMNGPTVIYQKVRDCSKADILSLNKFVEETVKEIESILDKMGIDYSTTLKDDIEKQTKLTQALYDLKMFVIKKMPRMDKNDLPKYCKHMMREYNTYPGWARTAFNSDLYDKAWSKV